VDGNGNRTTFTYTPLNLLETHTLPDGKVYSFEYDALHRMTARHTPARQVVPGLI
jgi:YD repeat-containing protein